MAPFFDEIADEVAIDIVVLGIGGCHVVNNKGNETLVVVVGRSRACYGTTKGGNKST
jgi:hypothetical protein